MISPPTVEILILNTKNTKLKDEVQDRQRLEKMIWELIFWQC